MSDYEVDDASFDARIAAIETALGPAVAAKIAGLGAALKARVEASHSGGVLANKSGALIGALEMDEQSDSGSTGLSIASHSEPHPRIDECNGKTAAHHIVEVKSKARLFMKNGKSFVVKSVTDPGSAMPERSSLSGALAEMQDEITSGLKEAVSEVVRAAV